MSEKSFEVAINPAVFKKIIENAGWSIEDVASVLKIDVEVVRSWEKGNTKPLYSHLERISKEIKKSVCLFLLSEPPKSKRFPKDFRMLPESQAKFSKETLLAMGQAIKLQEIASRLREKLDLVAKMPLSKASLKDNPEEVAKRERSNLGIDIIEQLREWKNAHQAFREWRAALENKDILTFQFGLPITDARGFSLTESEPFVIAVSSKDIKEARIFTLLHEYGHLLLRDQGVCIPKEQRGEKNGNSETEAWCNRFAAALLMPKGHIHQDLVKIAELKGNWYNALKKIANKYKVSKSAVLTRMVGLRIIDQDTYIRESNKSIKQDSENQKKRPKGGGKKGESRVIRKRGRKFVSLVVKGSRQGIVSTRDALDYLSTNLQEFQKLNG